MAAAATLEVSAHVPYSNATAESLELPSNLHEPFLQRAANASDNHSSSGHALGAFLTLRLVDQFTGDLRALHPDALAYQVRATRDYLAELQPQTAETNHLLEIVRVTDGVPADGNVRLLWPPLLAFAYWLENELRLEEALDTLDTALGLGGGLEGDEDVSTHLQRGRVLRLLGLFGEATEAYARGGEIALRLGDQHSELLSRIGRAIVLQKTGNLPESERVLRQVLEEAMASGDRDAEARASHDLSAALHHMGRDAEAVPLAFRAFEQYEQPARRLRALSDTAQILKRLGHYSAAKHALSHVLHSNPPPEIRHRAAVELLELSALMQDRLMFERLRRELRTVYKCLPFDEQVAFELSVGTGLAMFDLHAEGKPHIERAVALAESCGLGEMLFRAETALNELREHRTGTRGDAVPAQEAKPSPEVQSTIECLEAISIGL